MRILVVCGAGASSTFVAQRIRRAAAEAALPYSVVAGHEASLPTDLASADLVLLGPHLAQRLDDVRAQARPFGATVALLPDGIFTDQDGSRALAVVRDAVAGAQVEQTAAPNRAPTRRDLP